MLTDMLSLSWQFIGILWRTNPRWFVSKTAISIVGPILPIGQLVLGQKIIDALVSAIGRLGSLDWQRLLTLLILESLLGFASVILARIESAGDNTFQEEFKFATLNTLSEKVISLDLAAFDNPDFYNRVERLERDANWRPYNFYNGLFLSLNGFVTLLAAITLFLRLPLWVIGLLLAVALPTFWLQLAQGRGLYAIDDEYNYAMRRSNYYRRALGFRYQIKDVKLFGLERLFFTRYTEVWRRYLQAYRDLNNRFLRWQSLGWLAASLVRLGIKIWLAWQTLLARLTIGQFTLYNSLIGQLAEGLNGLLRNFAMLTDSRQFLENLRGFLAMRPVVTRMGTRRLPRGPLIIQFQDVSFRYPGQTSWALRDINLTLAPGKHVALVGENGAGKTTLIKLLAGFYYPTKGTITINGIDLHEHRPEAVKQMLGIIFQDFAQFQTTVAENIEFGDWAHRNQRGAETAARRSGADQFIRRLPQGYETLLAREFDRGVELSGGQWQKIALARTFFRGARLLILDEPTAALDAAAEEHFYRQFLKLKRDVSALLISHRFSTVRMADTIIVLHNGRIIEHGSHAQLMQQQGRYAKLFTLQAARYQ